MVVDVAARVGLDAAGLRAALESHAYAGALAQNAARARAQGVVALPTFFFEDGSRLVGARPYKEFTRLLETQRGR